VSWLRLQVSEEGGGEVTEVVIRPDDGDTVTDALNGAGALAADDPHGIANGGLVSHGLGSLLLLFWFPDDDIAAVNGAICAALGNGQRNSVFPFADFDGVHGLGLLCEFVVKTCDLITRASPDLHNVKFRMADHSAAKDVAAQTAHADNASVVAEWFVHVMSFRFVLMPPLIIATGTHNKLRCSLITFDRAWLFRRGIVMGAWQTA
jgi:hypothetical protein